MTALLHRFAGFLGSPAGFWATMAASGLSITFAWLINLEVATFALAWLAIILPALILVQQSAHNRALHMKLDDLIRVGPADNALRGIERQPREKIEEIDQRENGAP